VDPVLNPFTPGAGQPPRALVGRDRELAAVQIAIERLAQRRPARGLLVSGVRGVGKTVFVNEVRRRAGAAGWIVAKVEARRDESIRAALAQSLNAALRSASGRHPGALDHALAVFKSFSLSSAPDGSLALGIDLDAAGGIANTGNLTIDLTELLGELGTAAAALRIGVALLVDELHELDSATLAALAAATHDANQLGLPVVLFGAGLPNVTTIVAGARAYAERMFEPVTFAPFPDELAAEVLTAATTPERVGWTGDAMRLVIDAARGLPYFLQEYGRHVWDYALASPISGADARAGIAAADAELRRSFFGPRWHGATPAQQQYLEAVARVLDPDGRTSTRRVADELGRTLAALSTTRDQLLRKGILYAPDRGSLAFTTPGLAEFVRATAG
jgi:hypothetical protein